MKKDYSFVLLIAIADIVALNIITGTAIFFKDYTLNFGDRYFIMLIFFNLFWIIISFLINKYKTHPPANYINEVKHISKNIILFIGGISVLAFFGKDFLYSRAIIYGSSLALYATQSLLHYVLILIYKYWGKGKSVKNKLLIIGTNTSSARVYQQLTQENNNSYEIMGIIVDNCNLSNTETGVEQFDTVVEKESSFVVKDIIVTHSSSALNIQQSNRESDVRVREKFLEKPFLSKSNKTNNFDEKLNSLVLGSLDDVSRIFKELQVTNLIITLPLKEEVKIKKILFLADYYGIRVSIVPFIEFLPIENYKINSISGTLVFNVNEVSLDNYFNYLYKRIFDIIFSSIVLALLSPLFLFVSVLIKLYSRGPIYYVIERIGHKGKAFKLLKFRTMYHADENNGIKSTLTNDPRIVAHGQFLRKFSLDELPQFFNVLKGEMSVVGPRPHRINLNKVFQNDVEKYMTRHYIKPGITGWAQVNGWRGPTETKEQKVQRTKCDLWYIHNWTFWLDIKIIFLTVFSKKVWKNAF